MHTGDTVIDAYISVIIRESLKSESIKKENSIAVNRPQMCKGLIPMMFLCLSFAGWVFQAHSNFGLWFPEKNIRPEQGSNKCSIMSLTVTGSEYVEKE